MTTLLPDSSLEPPVYQVSELNFEVKHLLENSFQMVAVIGEISNLVIAHSGHIYFSLKDSSAQIKCAFFKQSARRLNFTPTQGQQVLVHARVTLYEARGDFQLVVQEMQLAGDGALQLAFLKLKQKLAAEGLFDPQHKKAIPRFAKVLGVITSPVGAAIHDIIKVIRRRCPILSIIVYPTLVQGNQAAIQIVNAIETANHRQECEVLLLARGGGSLEDLWPFNEEIVARAIFHSQLPIISAIGHEVDFTIADFVADLRAPTPSAAAEVISPAFNEWLIQLSNYSRRILRLMNLQFQQLKLALDGLQKRLRDPQQQLAEKAKYLAYLQRHLQSVFEKTLHHKIQHLQQNTAHLLHANPKHKLFQLIEELKSQGNHFLMTAQQQVERQSNQLNYLIKQLNTVNPLNTLQRGYAIATLVNHQTILRESSEVAINDAIQVQLAKGKLLCKVTEVQD